MLHSVIQVVPSEDYQVLVRFEDGKTVKYSAIHLLDKPVFAPLKDMSVFMNACKVMNDTLAWDIEGNGDLTSCIDIDPEMLYELPSSSS